MPAGRPVYRVIMRLSSKASFALLAAVLWLVFAYDFSMISLSAPGPREIPSGSHLLADPPR